MIATISSGVLVNRVLMGFGIEHLILRYPLAVTVSFLSFVLTMRLWLEYLRRSFIPLSRVMDFDDEPSATNSNDETKPSKWSDWGNLDPGGIDDACGCLILLFLILIVVVGGSAVVLVYESPLILAEVAFQFFLAAGLVRSAKRIDSPSWS